MKNGYLLCAAFLLSALPLQAAELHRNTGQEFSPGAIPGSATRFAGVVDDLPLMPGLHSVEDSDVLFGNPKDGRIADTRAEGEVDIDDVYNFYRKSLPQLGWKRLDARTYSREKEILHIDARAHDAVTTVEFSVTPAGK